MEDLLDPDARPQLDPMRVARAWVAVCLWAAVVWALGGDAFSASSTAAFLRPIIEWFNPDFSRQEMYSLLLGVRKTAHAAEYGLLALLILRALWVGSVRSLLASALVTALIAASMALADEVRQAYSSTRTGSALDVGLDLLGAICVVVLMVSIQAKRKEPLFAPAVPARGPAPPPGGLPEPPVVRGSE